MALDWIKMRTDIYRDPKVIAMADILLETEGDLNKHVNQMTRRDMSVTRNVIRNAIVGGLVTLWGVVRHQGKRNGDDISLSGVTVTAIDDIADLPGFGEALEFVGWVVYRKGGIVFPRFFSENNNDPFENARSKNAERQRRFKQKSNVTGNVTGNGAGNVTDNVTVTHREEKRREEKSVKASPTPSDGNSADADQAAETISGSALEFVRDSWNASGPIPCIRLTDKLRKSARARLKVPWWSENWLPALERLPQCRFLWGESDRGWKADLEWFLKPDSVQKILEGKYDNAGSTEATNREQSAFNRSIDALARFAASDEAGSRSGTGSPLLIEKNNGVH